MDIKVSLPKPNDTSGQHIKSFLRQLELCVHHLQKSIEDMEKESDISNAYVMYRFPYLERQYKFGENDIAKVHVDDASDGMQEIEIEINWL